MFQILGHSNVNLAALENISRAAIGVSALRNLPDVTNELQKQIVYISHLNSNKSSLKEALQDIKTLRTFTIISSTVQLNEIYYRLLENTDLNVTGIDTSEPTHKLIIMSGSLLDYKMLVATNAKGKLWAKFMYEINEQFCIEGLKLLWSDFNLNINPNEGKVIACLV